MGVHVLVVRIVRMCCKLIEAEIEITVSSLNAFGKVSGQEGTLSLTNQYAFIQSKPVCLYVCTAMLTSQSITLDTHTHTAVCVHLVAIS